MKIKVLEGKNPFAYGEVVSGRYFYDRTEVCADIVNSVKSRLNLVILGSRRYGKTSLVHAALDVLRNQGYTCVYFDLMRVASLEDFANRYAAVLYRESGAFAKGVHALSSLFRSLKPVIGMASDGSPEIALRAAPRQMTPENFEEVLDLPEKLAGKRKLVVVLDEFQELCAQSSRVNVEKIMRSVIQFHKRVQYVFLGSKTHILKRMFMSRARPFYNSVKVITVAKPPLDEGMDFLRNGFRSGRISLSENVAAYLLERSDNIPYYTQAIASEIFQTVALRSDRKVAREDVDRAVWSMLNKKRDYYEVLFSSFSVSQRNLMKAIASEPTGRFTETYCREHALGLNSSANTALKQLVDGGHVDTVNRIHHVSDPIFRLWMCE